MLRRLEDPGQRRHLALQEVAGGGRQQVRDALGGGVGAVSGAERIVDVDIGEPRQGLGEGRIVCLLGGMEPQVLEEDDIAVGHARDQRLDAGAHAVGRHRDGGAEQLREPDGRGPQRALRSDPALGAAEVRAQDHARSPGAQVLDRRQSRPDAGVVRHRARVERDVEVDPRQHPAAAELAEAGDRPLRHLRAGRRGRPGGSSSRTRCRTTTRSSPSGRWPWSARRRRWSCRSCRRCRRTRSDPRCRRGCP